MEASPQIRDWRNPAVIEGLVRPGYDERLFFHRYGHALTTRNEVRELGKWCAYEDAARNPDDPEGVNFYVLEWAALGHDYGYYEWTFLSDSEKARYPSREKYAAARTRGFMEELDAPEAVITEVEAAILSTELAVACTSREGRVLRQADLKNVGNRTTMKNLKGFLLNTVNLYREDRLLKGKSAKLFIPHEFISYCLVSHKILSTYNAEDVSLGDFDRTADGSSLFCYYAGEKIPLLAEQKRILGLAKQVGFKLLRDFRPKRLR